VPTAKGVRPIERLAPGDEVEFRDGTRSRLVHRAEVTVTPETFAARPELCPIRVPPLALGDAEPRRALVAAPDTLVMAAGRIVRRTTEADAVMIPLAALVGHGGIEQRRVEPAPITFHHLLCADHGPIDVEGLTCETLFLGHSADPDLVVGLHDVRGDAAHGTRAIPLAAGKSATALIEKLRDKNRTLSGGDDAA
ncbi:MAG: Hint domain-containing protein, partial [Shimia sp.]